MAAAAALRVNFDLPAQPTAALGVADRPQESQPKRRLTSDQPLSAVETFTTHTPPASDESHNGDDVRSNKAMAEPGDIDNGDDGSSDLSELDFGDEENQNVMSMEPTEEERGRPIDDIYADIQPAEWSGEIPIFRPSTREFADFQKYMEAVNPYGMQSGVILVDPPQEYKDSRPDLDERVKSIVNKRPIRQEFLKSGTNFGSYRVNNIEKQRTYNLPQWRAVCDDPTHQPPAPRGQARAGTVSKPTRSSTSKPPSTPLPLPPGQKRKPGRPRVHAVKEEAIGQQTETDRTLVAPPTPTSPKIQPEASVDSEDKKEDTTNTPPAKKRAGRKPKAASAQGTPRSKAASGSNGEKATSIAARRKHNEGVQSYQVDEKAFEGFDYRIHNQEEYTAERCAELEQKYWKSLMFAEPMYGADMPGSLFTDDEKTWNVANLPNLLDVMESKIPGVNTAYLYLGMWKASFAWHVEDMDLYSINYLHFGAPKQWYSISQRNLPKFEKVMKELFPQDAKVCDQFLRHKSYTVTPETLEKKGVKVNRMVHREGQFVITYPMGYHSGFNLGYNCAESVNFALESWLPFFEKTQKCQCEPDNVFIDYDWLMRRIRNEPTPDVFYEEIEVSDDEDYDIEGLGGLPTPPTSVKSQAKAGVKRKRGAPTKEKQKKKIRIAIKKHQPCVLCPNDYQWESLLPTAEGKQAHRSCALYLSETYIINQDGQDVVFGVDKIGKERSKLRCSFCHITRGACFQCSSQKCTKPYHGTCALLAGVQIDIGEVTFYHEDVEYKDTAIDLRCKLHRTIKSSVRDDDPPNQNSNSLVEYASKLKANDVVQFQRSRGDEIFTAVVKCPLDYMDRTIIAQVLPEDSNGLSLLNVDDLLYVNETNTCFNPPSATAIPLPPELLHERFATKSETVDDDSKKPSAGDTFFESVDGSQKLEWAEFLDLAPEDKSQLHPHKPVDLFKDPFKEPTLWYYLGGISTETKDLFTADPTTQVPDSRANPDALRPAASRTSVPTTFSPYQPRLQSLISSPKPNQAALNAAKYHSRPSLPSPRSLVSQNVQQVKPETITFNPSVINADQYRQSQVFTAPAPPQLPQLPPLNTFTPPPPSHVSYHNSPRLAANPFVPATMSSERSEKRRLSLLDQYSGRSVKPGVTPDGNKMYHQCYFSYGGESGDCMFIKRRDEIKKHWEAEHKNKYTYDHFDSSRVIPVVGDDRVQYINLAYGKKWTGPSNPPPPHLTPPVRAPTPPRPLPPLPHDLSYVRFRLPSGGQSDLFPKHLFDYPQKEIPQPIQHLSHITSVVRHDILSHSLAGVSLREEVIRAVSAMPPAVRDHRQAVLKCVGDTPPGSFALPTKLGYDGAYDDPNILQGQGWALEWAKSLPPHMRALIGR